MKDFLKNTKCCLRLKINPNVTIKRLVLKEFFEYYYIINNLLVIAMMKTSS